MPRLLTALVAALLCGLTAAPPLLARSGDDGPGVHRDGKRAPRHESGRRHGRDRKPRGIPPLFRELCPFRAGRIERAAPDRLKRRTLQRIHRLVRELENLKDGDPREYEQRARMLRTEDSVARIADRYRNTGNEKDRERLEKELRELIGELFDQKEAAQRSRIRRMERQIESMTKRIDKRRKERDRIIEDKLENLKKGEDGRF